MPDVILKDQTSNVPNYPINLVDADMNGIDDIETKNNLVEKWSEVNG